MVLQINSLYEVFVILKQKFSVFWKRLSFFQKTCFKIEILKTFKISSDYHIKTCRSLKRRAILVFRSTYAHSVSFKMKSMRSWRQSVFLCLDKNQLKFCRKIIGKTFVAAIVVAKVGATVDFLSIWWINQFKHLYSLISDNELNWLCKHMKKVRSSHVSISMNYCVELCKTQFFLVSIDKDQRFFIYHLMR